MNKKYWIAAGVVVVIVAAAAAWYYTRVPEPFTLSSADQPIAWSLPPLQNVASATPALPAQIKQFTSMLGGYSQYPDETIYIAIANDYISLGDGYSAFQNYERSIHASSTDALAYYDLAGLLARVHATSSAERAYAEAVALTPTQLLFQLGYVDYLAQVAPTADATAAAFLSAKQALGPTTPDLLIAEAAWLGQIGSTTAAISDWETVRSQVSPAQQASIDARIAELRKQSN